MRMLYGGTVTIAVPSAIETNRRPSLELVSTAGTKAIDGDNVPNPSDRPCKRSKTE